MLALIQTGIEKSSDPDRQKRTTNPAIHMARLAAIAERRGGRLEPGQQYKGVTSKLWFADSDGTRFEGIPDSIYRGAWNTLPFKRLPAAQKIAAKNGGECLSTAYVDGKTKMKWQCGKGHIWESTYACVVTDGAWCHKCAKNATYEPRDALEKCAQHAASMGGGLSVEWVGAKSKYEWRCNKGHIWSAAFGNIFHKKNPTWCPECSKILLLSEAKTRSVFEQMFDGKFENKKPSWLKSPAGGSLELDGFNEELALAFEYQGEQHYRVVACLGDESALAKQMKNDAFKAKKCVENGVFLIQVPYTIPDANLALSVFLSVREKAQLNDLVQRVAEKKGHVWDEKEPLSNKNGPHAHAQPSIDKALKHDRLNEGKAIAQRRGGVLLSKIWLGARYLYDWKCSGCGLEWKASFDNVRRGTWCPICAIKEAGLRRRKPSHEMRAEAMALAAIKGGALVSPEWNTMHTKYQWRCEAGHLWFAAYRDIKRGSWCRACARSKTAIEMWKTRPRKASKSLALTAENH